MIQTLPIFPGRFRAQVWQLIAASLIVLTMPVNYRGGADLPHPHAFFQFWASGDVDAFDHHDPRGPHRPAPAAGSTLVTGPTTSASIEASPDTPVVDNFTWPGERADGIPILVVVALLALLTVMRPRGFNRNWSIPDGRRLCPEIPPPQY